MTFLIVFHYESAKIICNTLILQIILKQSMFVKQVLLTKLSGKTGLSLKSILGQNMFIVKRPD